jgi:hypothetical protein
MSQNIETVNTYLDGFRKNDHEQILSCLTDDIKWTVFGAFHLTGKEAYDKAIDGAPELIDPPELEVVRVVEQGDRLFGALYRYLEPYSLNLFLSSICRIESLTRHQLRAIQEITISPISSNASPHGAKRSIQSRLILFLTSKLNSSRRRLRN